MHLAEPARFAQAVIQALEGPQRDIIAANGRKYVEEHHDWPTLLQDVDRYLGALNPACAQESSSKLRTSGLKPLELQAGCKS